ncbi:MAG: SDR family NAD(P)-dependent oxidoreductase [Cyclobacteriaceae bacterium]
MKKYLIVGGSTGIGFQLVKSLVEEGHEAIVVSRTFGNLNEILDVQYISYNVTSDEQFSLDEEIIDGFVYCPGSINLKPFQRIKPEEFVNDFELNVLGAIRVLQCVLPALKESDQASVVSFGTVAVQQGMEFTLATDITRRSASLAINTVWM